MELKLHTAIKQCGTPVQSSLTFSFTNVCNTDKKQRDHLSAEFHFLGIAFQTLKF